MELFPHAHGAPGRPGNLPAQPGAKFRATGPCWAWLSLVGWHVKTVPTECPSPYCCQVWLWPSGIPAVQIWHEGCGEFDIPDTSDGTPDPRNAFSTPQVSLEIRNGEPCFHLLSY